MKMIVENGEIQNVDRHDAGQLSKPVPHPVLVIAEVLARERIPSEQMAATDESIPTVIDADLIGIPIRVVVGAKSLANGQVEVSLRRDGEKKLEPLADAVGAVLDAILAESPD